MSGLKEIKRRQKTAMIIQRMTGAMKMISRARYTSAQNEVRKNDGLMDVLQHLSQRIVREMDGINGEALGGYAQEGPPEAPWLLLVMTSDSGLCGGFNQKLIKTALEWLAARKNELVHVLCLGKKGLYGLQKKPGVVMFSTQEPVTIANFKDSITTSFKEGRLRGCFVLYGKFFNILKQEPEMVQILPTPLGSEGQGKNQTLSGETLDEGRDTQEALVLEPDGKTVLNGVLEMLVQATLKKILEEHRLSEHAARMNAMDSAHSNASDVIRRLQIKYNRLRQDRITKEIIEIIAGSEMNMEA